MSRTNLRFAWAIALGGAAWSAVACQAQPARQDQVSPSGGMAGRSSGTDPNGGGSGGSAGIGMPPLAAPPGPQPVRRLTHVEYNNTVADLLGDTTAPASRFSADVAQDGFTNNAAGQSVSPALAEQYMTAAEALSQRAIEQLPALLGCDPTISGEAACVQQFVRDFGERAFRRPLTAAESQRLQAVFDRARATLPLDKSVQRVLQVMLQSPQFIYLLEPSPAGSSAGSVVPLDSWQVASRLSYFLLGSLPDEALFAEAERGALITAEQVAAQARRLLQLPRARQRIGLFFTEWLQLRNVDRMQKDPTLFPHYSLELGPLLQEQVRLFAQSIVLDGPGTAADLLTAPFTFMSPELSPLYGMAPPPTPGFSRVELDPTRRVGLLTHVGILASLAKANQNDPVHRGKFVRERLLCQTVPPPPVNANITPPEVRPDATTRERFAQHRADASCAACHRLMDPIGLGFEHYDALGQWRDTENGLPIDATGEVYGSDVEGPFDGALELVQKLAQSQQVKDCLVQTWFRFAHGRSATDADGANLQLLNARFAQSAYQLSELLVAVTETQAFRQQLVPDPNAGASGQVTP